MDKLFYTVSQAAELVGENTTTVRFWSNRFKRYIAPKRNAKGNRLFRPEDLEVLKKIGYYSRECGLSLDAIERKLSGGEASGDEKMLQVRDSLLRIREQLTQIRETL